MSMFSAFNINATGMTAERYRIQVSTVPKSRSPFSAFSLAPSTLSKIHLIFVAEK